MSKSNTGSWPFPRSGNHVFRSRFQKNLLAFVHLLVLLILVLSGCGGSNGSGSVGGTGEPLSFAIRMAVIEAITIESEGLTYDNFITDSPRILSFLRARSEIAEAFVEPLDDRTIWAKFTDGRWLVISRNRPFQPGAAGRSTRDNESPGINFLSGNKASVFFSFSETEFTNVADAIAPRLTEAGFDIQPGRSGTLEDYRALASSNLLYIDSHGFVISRNGTADTYLQSGTQVTQEQEANLAQELSTGELVYVTPPVRNKPINLAFNGQWVRNNVRLASRALVFANTCNSQATSGLADAFVSSGAGAYFGWTKPVEDRNASDSARFLFDYLLGSPGLYNYFSPEEEPTEPTTWTESFNKMKVVRRNSGSFTLAQSIQNCVLRTSGVNFALGTIRPKISRVTSNERNNVILLEGVFGGNPGTVTINPGLSQATQLPVRSWTSSSVTVDYTAQATSFQITAEGIKSNTFSIPMAEYALVGQNGGSFAVKETMTLWLSGTQIYQNSSAVQGPIRFMARPGQLLRMEVRSTANSGGTSQILVDPPTTVNYPIRPNALDLLVNPQTRVVFDQSWVLEP